MDQPPAVNQPLAVDQPPAVDQLSVPSQVLPAPPVHAQDCGERYKGEARSAGHLPERVEPTSYQLKTNLTIVDRDEHDHTPCRRDYFPVSSSLALFRLKALFLIYDTTT